MSNLRPNQHYLNCVSSDFGKSNGKNTTAYFFSFSYFLIQPILMATTRYKNVPLGILVFMGFMIYKTVFQKQM